MPRPKATKPTKPVSVLDRRLQSPNPFGEGSPTVQLKEPGWTVHVINAQLRPGRYHDVVNQKGWVPVLPEDLDGSPEDFGFDIKDGRVVRGERGSEVLVKMPTKYVRQVQMQKDAHNRALVSPRRMKAAVVEQAAGQYSEQAAEYVGRTVTIKTERAPVPLEEVDTPTS